MLLGYPQINTGGHLTSNRRDIHTSESSHRRRTRRSRNDNTMQPSPSHWKMYYSNNNRPSTMATPSARDKGMIHAEQDADQYVFCCNVHSRECGRGFHFTYSHLMYYYYYREHYSCHSFSDVACRPPRSDRPTSIKYCIFS